MAWLSKSVLLLLLMFSCFSQSFADEVLGFNIKIVNHRFIPDVIKVPSNTKFFLMIENTDSTAEEFESIKLKKEKIVLPKKTIKIMFSDLKKGNYEFVGEFHHDTAKGEIIVN